MKIVSVCVLLLTLFASMAFAQPLLDANDEGFDGQTRSENYDALMHAYVSNGNVVTSINDDLLWVPWFKTSSGSQIADLQDGDNCNVSRPIDFSHNCMVTDEFSQIGILLSMGKDQVRMDQFYNTVLASKSTNGYLPSWRIYRDGDVIEACKPGINDNCDTASDGTARIIMTLFTASKNPYFEDAAQKEKYAVLAKKIADDMLTYEVDTTCRPTSFGTVCYWLAGGSNVKRAGISSTDFAYTGYYPDAIIAMLEAYANTNDEKYYDAARDFTLNYLQAAGFNNQDFSVPPGKSFKWVLDSNGVPSAQCTNTCDPVMWDSHDASRALGLCQANYYAKEMNVELPYLQEYCQLLTQEHMNDPTSAPLQFYPDGSPVSLQSGYFAQGLQSLHLAGADPALFEATLDTALSHYTPETKTFDNAASIGVYTQSFAVRALGMGIGRDLNAFRQESIEQTPAEETPQVTYDGIASLSASCTYDSVACDVKSDVTSGVCRTLVYSTSSGDIKLFSCEKSDGYVEMYMQSAPTDIHYEVCLADGCITKDNRFARFIPTITTQTPTTTTPDPVSTPIITEETPLITDGIASLSASCTYDSVACDVKSDVTSGVCRTLVYSTSSGDIKVFACEKSGGYVELYMQSAPTDIHYEVCLADGCITKDNGFARFIPATPAPEPVTSSPEPVTPAPEPVTSEPKSIGSLTPSCSVEGLQCGLSSDVVSGTCRTILYDTGAGTIKIMACEKGENIEVYRQEYPSGMNFDVCLDGSCIDEMRGFISFPRG